MVSQGWGAWFTIFFLIFFTNRLATDIVYTLICLWRTPRTYRELFTIDADTDVVYSGHNIADTVNLLLSAPLK